MKHKLFVNQLGDLKLIVDGDLSGEELKQILDEFENFTRKRAAEGKQANIIVEATNLGHASAENRREALNRLKNLNVNKMAVYGKHNAYAKYMTLMAAKAFHLPNMRYLDSREEAEEWLNQDRR